VSPSRNTMNHSIGLGFVGLAAPATATWTVPLAVYYLSLQTRVVLKRFASHTLMGDHADGNTSASDPLFVATRAQLNFLENVPIALIVALVAELNGAERSYINYALGTLFAVRIAHVEFGLTKNNAAGYGRAVGYYGSQAIIAGLSGYLAYLVKDYWMA
ncbi:hypothetical protein M011DRAFT_393910, partial [Sporormia fimetaria CBS 119925]